MLYIVGLWPGPVANARAALSRFDEIWGIAHSYQATGHLTFTYELVGSVPFTWSQYLTLATELGARPDEASLRSSISRAYYYVYHLALQRAQANEFDLKLDEGTHAQLWAIYSGNPEPECQKLATIANRMREKRIKADYKSVFARISEEIPGVLADAKTFTERS